MTKCNFCGNQIRPGTGKIYVKTEGKIYNFCSNKCEKNTIKLKRKPAHARWTKTHHKEKRGG